MGYILLTMSLLVVPENYEGQLLCYQPAYGWGWSRLDKTGSDSCLDYAVIDQAGIFHIKIHRFFSFRGELRGVIGRVEQPLHMFNQMWAVTYTMHVGEYDFAENLCHRWDIELSLATPSEDDWPKMHNASPIYSGYGILAISHDAIIKYRNRQRMA
jgi:hypothetical protein